MTAHVVLLDCGPRAAVRCPPCDLDEEHDDVRPAQESARAHNTEEHA